MTKSVLGLPGRKFSTVRWMTDLLDGLDLGDAAIATQEYGFASADRDHSNPDPAPEARMVADSGADLVITKSFGTLVTILANREFGFQPAKCVMIAVPLVRFKIQNLMPLLHHHCASVPTLFIQQTDDFNGPYAETAAEVGAYPGRRAAEVAGNSHLYSDLKELKRLIEAWLYLH